MFQLTFIKLYNDDQKVKTPTDIYHQELSVYWLDNSNYLHACLNTYWLIHLKTELMDRGVISIQLGQCGVQIADSLWELLCLEHDICLDGSLKKKNRKNLNFSNNSVFFEECSNGKYIPRSILFDTEPTVVGKKHLI